MKRTILTLAFFIGSVFGGMMMTFGNPLGDLVTIASVVLGLYVTSMEEPDSEFSQEGIYERYEPRKWNSGSN
jgi:hypothetical protein